MKKKDKRGEDVFSKGSALRSWLSFGGRRFFWLEIEVLLQESLWREALSPQAIQEAQCGALLHSESEKTRGDLFSILDRLLSPDVKSISVGGRGKPSRFQGKKLHAKPVSALIEEEFMFFQANFTQVSFESGRTKKLEVDLNSSGIVGSNGSLLNVLHDNWTYHLHGSGRLDSYDVINQALFDLFFRMRCHQLNNLTSLCYNSGHCYFLTSCSIYIRKGEKIYQPLMLTQVQRALLVPSTAIFLSECYMTVDIALGLWLLRVQFSSLPLFYTKKNHALINTLTRNSILVPHFIDGVATIKTC
ncbi:hypothetical protein VNO77_39098 [Canavalia gladiata]|uniref:Uncharacterized protein n=1 Tax=Canavalia gladiata TaxID=3824 RepID=A0AAN9PXX8_CANGL